MSAENNRSTNNQLDTCSNRAAQEEIEYKAFSDKTDRGCGYVALAVLTLTACKIVIWVADNQVFNEALR
jgi:hypothetical protein